jgi:hypothetical protein
VGRIVTGRDRDAAGRPRSARPRDVTGRPLPRGAVGVPGIPEGLVVPAPEALATAQVLLDEGRPFAAHEVLEAVWKAAPAAERELWRGLAQLAVGLTHLQRGNGRGAAALLRRAAERIGTFPPGQPYRVDTAGLAVLARRLAENVDRSGVPARPPTVRLTLP